MNLFKYNIVILNIFFIFLLSNNVFAQKVDLKVKINIHLNNKSLRTVLDEISKTNNVFFSYSNRLIDDKQKVNISATNIPLDEVLKQLFGSLGIEYVLVEKQIILKPKPKPKENPQEEKKKQQRYTLSGYLKDKETSEIIIGAVVSVQNKNLGTVTNPYGFYSLTLPEGDYMIAYKSTGYKYENLQVQLNKNKQINQLLEVQRAFPTTKTDSATQPNPDSIRHDTFTVNKLTITTIPRFQNFVGKIDLAKTSFLQKLDFISTSLGTEIDLLKMLQTMPGILMHGDGSVFFYVHGGNRDQNAILIDEAPIYNPAHLFGFFSAITPQSINDIKVFKSDIPIQFGGRLSSTIDIKTKEGNLNRFNLYGNVGLLAASLTVESPIVKERCSFTSTVRRSYLSYLLDKKDKDLQLYFYDIQTKINFIVNDKNRLYYSIYYGKDYFSKFILDTDNYGISWDNLTSSLRWNHLFSDRLFSNLTIYGSRYNYYLYVSKNNNNYWTANIGNISAKYDFTFYPNPQNTLRFGVNTNLYQFTPGFLKLNVALDNALPKVQPSNALENIFYCGNEQELSDVFYLTYGLRVGLWQNLGPIRMFLYDENHQVRDSVEYKKGVFNQYLTFEPRVSLQCNLSETSSLKFSYNRTVQNLQLISNSISPFTTIEIWMPSGPNIKPQKADPFSVGYSVKNQSKKVEFSSEVFVKRMLNQIDYKDHANLLANPHIEGELRFGTAKAYGIETVLRKTEGNFTGWIAYTYSRCRKLIEGVNQNREFVADYDKPHYVNINASYTFFNRLLVSLNWTYNTGTPFTTPTGFYRYDGYTVPIYDAKNNSRLPDYHRLDFAATLQLNKNRNARYLHSLTLSVYNVYNRQNPIGVNFNKIETKNGDLMVPRDLLRENQLIPTSISLISIMPYITYNFRFR